MRLFQPPPGGAVRAGNAITEQNVDPVHLLRLSGEATGRSHQDLDGGDRVLRYGDSHRVCLAVKPPRPWAAKNKFCYVDAITE